MLLSRIPISVRRILLGLCLATGLSSCITQAYIPLAPAAPLLLEAGDFALAGNIGYASLANGSFAYAFVDHFSFQLQGAFDPAIGGTPDWVSADAALGYHAELGGDWRMDLYVGAGKADGQDRESEASDYCWVCMTDGIPDWTSTIKTTRASLNTNVGIRQEKYSLVLGVTAAYVHVDHFQLRWQQPFGDEVDISRDRDGHDPFLTIETSLMLRLNTRTVFSPYGFISYGFALPDYIKAEGHYLPLTIGVGLQFRTNLLNQGSNRSHP
jgi:hypothetical protein